MERWNFDPDLIHREADLLLCLAKVSRTISDDCLRIELAELDAFRLARIKWVNKQQRIRATS